MLRAVQYGQMPRFRTYAACAIAGIAACAPVAFATSDSPDMRVVRVNQASILRDVRDGVVAIAAPDGTTQRFRVRPMHVAAPALERRYPGNHVFQGEGVDDPRARVVLGTGLQGFHAQVLTPRGDWYTDRRGDGSYVTYEAGSGAARSIDQQPPIRVPGTIQPAPRIATIFPRTSGTELRTYRFALATTGEYSAHFGGTKPLVHAELILAMARINGIYQSEVSARFELVANNDQLIYLDPAADPYTNSDGGAMLDENQTTVDAAIGSANYDLGHVFSTGGGGVAYLGVLGVGGSKAGGVTGNSNPTGDDFWVDYVAHEVGHQMGGEHTFQGVSGSCTGNGESSAAMEPGSGSTIMAYAGICGTDDLQPHSDAYFHAKSYDQIRAVMEAVPGVGTATATGNRAPVISLPATTYTVPPRTPLRLEASATDADGDAITYGWEQYDAGALRLLSIEPKPDGALFRAYSPTASGVRYAPAHASVLAGWTNQATGSCASFAGAAQLACRAEFLPTTDRSMTFRVTARDNASGGGGVSAADVSMAVSGNTPFAVTSQAAAQSVNTSTPLAVTWDAAGTAGAPYNVSGVDILLSVDGGATYGRTLASNTPNDGSQAVSLAGVADGASLRIMVRGHGSIFYDISDASLTAVDTSGPDIQITTPADGASYTQGQAVTAHFACTDPAGVATCAGTVADGAAIDTSVPGTRTFTVAATDTAAHASDVSHTYTVAAPPITPTTPAPTPVEAPFGMDMWAAGTLVGKGVVGERQQISRRVRPGRTATYVIVLANTGSGADSPRITGGGSRRAWRVRYLSSTGGDITYAVTHGGWTPQVLAPGGQTTVTVRVTPTAGARGGAILPRTLSVTSGGNPSVRDGISLRTLLR
jgi:hypothetical protein